MSLTPQQERVAKVLDNMKAMALRDSEYADFFAECLDPMLQDLHGNDAFGTEGQCDPRGDFRNGVWSMTRVEGIDG